MARINIEDSFWISMLDVAAKSGSVDSAIGNAMRFFRLAQQKYKNGEYITEDEFRANGFSDALFPSIACRTPNGIQAVGADEHFAWLKSKVENGRKGGQSKSESKSIAAKEREHKKRVESEQNDQLEPQATTSEPQANHKRPQASPSPSPSDSSERVLSSSSPPTATQLRVSDASRMESRFRNYANPDREKYREVLRGFVQRTDPRLKFFLTERFVDQAMAAFSSPTRFFDYLESVEMTWRAKKPENPQAYFKASWRENVLDRLGDVAIGPALAEGAR